MSDAEIAELYQIPRSTVQYRRTSSFELLKRYLEEHAYDLPKLVKQETMNTACYLSGNHSRNQTRAAGNEYCRATLRWLYRTPFYEKAP